MLEVIILTSDDFGLAAHHLPFLLKSEKIKIKGVIVSKGIIINKKKYFKNKFAKMIKIGFFGTLNGIRMRKWYSDDLLKLDPIQSLYSQCLNNGIPYHVVNSTNSEETQWLFKQAKASVGLSLGNGFISKKIFSIPKFGMINIHHEQLPEYQNAQSVIWQLYNNSKETGYTIHKIDSKIDTGAILFQENISISFQSSLNKTVTKTLVDLQKASAKGLVKVLENFDNYYINATPQGIGRHYTTPSLMKFIKIYRNFNKLKRNCLKFHN